MTRIYTAIGDCRFHFGAYDEAREALQQAVAAPDGLGNPFVHLRLVQVQFELGQLDRSADELARAYMGGGSEIFEDEDPKYWDFIRSKLQPPA